MTLYAVSDDKDENPSKNNTTTSLATTTREDALSLQDQAQALRAQAQAMEASLQESKELKRNRELAKVDQWIDDLLIQQEVNDKTQLLNSAQQTMELLRDKRYSQEQVQKIFKRICDTIPGQCRSKQSPLMTLLVDAAGKLDDVEREDNPNKRWSGRVEQDLQRRLFAKDWGIELEEVEEEKKRR